MQSSTKVDIYHGCTVVLKKRYIVKARSIELASVLKSLFCCRNAKPKIESNVITGNILLMVCIRSSEKIRPNKRKRSNAMFLLKNENQLPNK